MTINQTLNNLTAQRSDLILTFGAPVGTASIYLNGGGGVAGDGYPLPKGARAYRIDCWDGASLNSDTDNVLFSQGDRISVYAEVNGGSFDVKVRKNGVSTALVAASVSQSATLLVSVHLKFVE